MTDHRPRRRRSPKARAGRARGIAAALAAGLLLGGGIGTPSPAEAQEPRPVSLDEAVEIALRQSPDVDEAAARVEGAESGRLGAFGSFLPRVDLGYGYSNSSTGRLDPTGQGITNTSWTAQLTASYNLFSGFSRLSRVRSARRDVRAANARFEERRYQTILDVKTSYFAAVANRELVAVQERRVERQEAQLDSVRVGLEIGQLARTDVLRSQVALNNARLELVRARSAARASNFELSRAVGAGEPIAPSPEASLDPEPLPFSRERLQTMAVAAGPSLRAARAEAEAAAAQVGVRRSAYLPDFNFSGGWAWSNEEFPPQRRSWRIFLFGSYPLFDGFRREEQLGRAEADANAARARARATELQLVADVNAAYDQAETARSSLRLAETTVELSREELEMQRERFRLGRGTILELQEAQIALEQAEADRVRARFDYQLGLARLEYLLGRDLPEGEEDGGDAGGDAPGDPPPTP